MTSESRPKRVILDLSDAQSQNVQIPNRTRKRPPMLVGYARTSTADQIAGLDAQARELNAAGCTKLFTDQV